MNCINCTYYRYKNKLEGPIILKKNNKRLKLAKKKWKNKKLINPMKNTCISDIFEGTNY